MKETQTDKPHFIDAKRRGFLQRSAIAGGVAASGALSSQAQADHLPLIDEAAEVSKHAGYQLTDKVKEYYRKARF